MGSDITDSDPEVMESLKYLVNSTEERIKNQSMPFDAKVQCWIEDEKDGFLASEIQETNGDDVTVKTSKGETVIVKKDKLMEMNPPKYYQCEDMADLTYLNEATVFFNLSSRYLAWKIYTYSGLFCITINPFKRLPVYTHKIMNLYRGKKRTEVPPHLYSIADNAYQNMLRDRENQSMLITGESGAGKTENTKKVIQYLASVAAADKPKGAEQSDKPQVSLEDQIVAANPVLEAYGNAKTTRNNNSSRFGKFIRIHFGPSGKIAGADIESYLLEKSRIVYQQPVERNYHIFYQLLAKNYPKYHTDLLVQPDPAVYFYINQGMLSIDRVDDGEEMKATDEAFDCLGFAQEEKLDLFKATAAIMHWGNSQWKQKPKEEQAECDGTEECEKVAHLFGIEAADLIKGLLKPRIKVGNDYVNKGQNKEQVINSVGALSKSLFDRMFRWLVDRVNNTLDAKTKRQYFIGVLDIAGFEIFDFNTFEQLCINYTNERLQQFFNHHMFVLEQEEYKKEGIKWEMMNFGLDLQACIDLIEKPLGILSILEEECIVPKASDKTFVDKLYAQHLGKHPAFGKPKPQKGKPEAHFELHHYAGTVAYNITDWLNKNKDPINTTVANLMKNSKNNALLRLVFGDVGEEEDKKSGAGKQSKKGAQTLSATHREQLNKLMNTLKATSPHFVRCIIPNEIKTGGILDSHLVMHQLTCNGVLEGIRICRKGFPNRMLYQEFKQRYSILAPNVIPKGFVDATKASGDILKEIKLDEALYRLGNTKVFFKAGVLGQLEEYRDEALSKIISKIQANIRSFVIRKSYKKMIEQRLATSVLQRNIKAYLGLKNWSWFKLLAKVKPLLSNSRLEEEAKAKEEEMKKQMEKLAHDAAAKADLEAKVAKLEAEKKDLLRDLEAERDVINSVEDRVQLLVVQKAELETKVNELIASLATAEGTNNDLEGFKAKLQQDIENLEKEKETFLLRIQKIENDNRQKENQLKQDSEEIYRLDEALARVTREKKKSDESNARLSDELQIEMEKVNNLNRIKTKLEQNIDEAEENLEHEKRAKSDLEKVKRKLEGELKSLQTTVEEIDRIRRELEEELKKKDQENHLINKRIDEDQILLNNSSKKNKELLLKIGQLEEELEIEKQTRIKIEKQRCDLTHELDDLAGKLEEAGGLSNAQQELNKRREAELSKLRHDIEQANVLHEETVSQMRKKHQEAVYEMAEQIDQLQKAKNRIERDKQTLKIEIDDLNVRMENSNKAKLASEKAIKHLEQQLSEIQGKLEDSIFTINDTQSQKSRLLAENSELQRQIEDLEAQIINFSKLRQQLNAQIEAGKRAEEEESRAKGSLIQQLRNLSTDYEQLKEEFEESEHTKNELIKALSKSNQEVQHWRTKYENESRTSGDELDEAKRKLSLKLQEAEEQVEEALSKCNNLEKTKQRLQAEIEDLMIDVEKANANAASLERKQKQFDKLIDDWKKKCEEITNELQLTQKESRNYANEVYRLKTIIQESNELNEILKRENKNLSDEIRDLMDQIGSDGKSYHELEKLRKRVEIEKDELQVSLEASEVALQAQIAKVNKLQTQLIQTRNEIDKKLQEKEDEFENTRRTHAFALESIQTSLDAETKAKHDILKIKKKLEMDLSEFEVKYDLLKRSNGELLKQNRKMLQDNSDLQAQLDNNKRLMDEMNEALSQSERKYSIIIHELEETRLSLEQSERVKKSIENELHETTDKISELNTQYSNLSAAKRKIENDLNSAQNDLSDMDQDLKNTQEKLRKSLNEQLKLEDELRMEREHLAKSDSLRKDLEIQLKDIQLRLNDAEMNALKGGKRLVQKLEQRIHELESQLDLEHKHNQETLKEMKKNDKRIKDLIIQSEDDRRNQIKLQELIEALQHKIKVYKRQTEEAEEIAASNLAKYRKLQVEFENTQHLNDRCESTESNLLRFRTRNRQQTAISVNNDEPQRGTSVNRNGSVLRNQQ